MIHPLRLGLLWLGTAAAAGALAQAIDLPAAPGKAQVQAACTRCHGVDVIMAQRRTPDEWQEVLSVMIGHGAEMSDADYQAILAYLSANLAPPAAGGTNAAPNGTQPS